MLKKMSFLILSLLLIASCGGDKAQEEATAAADAVPHLTVAEFNANGEAYEGKLVEISGTVDHVCKHSGKRLFIMGENPDDRVKIESGDVGSFDIALEGSQITVQAVGVVMKMDGAYLDNWASEVSSEEPAAGCSEEQKDMGVDAVEENSALAQIAELRKELADSGRDYLAFCSLEAKTLAEAK